MLNTLSYIGEKLNNANILWGVGASILLSRYGLAEEPNDIDILVHIGDIERAEKILNQIGKKQPKEESCRYSTKYFYEYIVQEIDVDVMAGLEIHHKAGVYQFIFDYKSIVETQCISGVEIPFNALEDWFIIYQLIPNREAKVMAIEEYLISKGIKNPHLLKRALAQDLPKEVKDRVNFLLVQ